MIFQKVKTYVIQPISGFLYRRMMWLLVVICMGCVVYIVDSFVPFLNPVKQVPLLTSKHQYFMDTTGSVDKFFLDQLNAKAAKFEDIGVLCIGIFTNRTDISPAEVVYHFGKKNRINENGQKRENVIGIGICLPKVGGRYPEDSIGFAIDNVMEKRLDEDLIHEFKETTFVPASQQLGFKRWQEGLLLLLDKTYLYLQNPRSPNYLNIVFTPSLLDRLMVIVACLLVLFFCIQMLRGKSRQDDDDEMI